MDEYKVLAEKSGLKICDINSGTFWIPWEDTGAFVSLEDAKEHSLAMNEQNEVIWGYSLKDLQELVQ